MSTAPNRLPLTGMVKTLLVAALLVSAGYLLARYFDRQEQVKVEHSSIDQLVVALRENRNRLQVYRLSGSVTTKRETTGGPGGILQGTMTVKQPWSVAYFVDMGAIGLDDYVWDERTRTLLVRAPTVRPEAPNIDESRQVVAYNGPLITRDMQTRLRGGVAVGARQQAAAEAAKPENVAAATEAARAAIARNLQAPLAAAGLGKVHVEVRGPDRGRQDSERWDVSRSIADVLAERAGR
ncbi:hypothetical protein OMW55_10550 [Sphingomonas sp. BN140010]|uniref:DUF4230 domain-containing protein n=1 Tax=Sphingomonas arvum TaxID=2992113 RepID=A0ABT3JGN6_9SPHN|nr:hypothetical protein [Sphingomonas sp. BN140010]MCW3798240.1 hypothetical protein [Sphingomonas sp. BN140010]